MSLHRCNNEAVLLPCGRSRSAAAARSRQVPVCHFCREIAAPGRFRRCPRPYPTQPSLWISKSCWAGNYDHRPREGMSETEQLVVLLGAAASRGGRTRSPGQGSEARRRSATQRTLAGVGLGVPESTDFRGPPRATTRTHATSSCITVIRDEPLLQPHLYGPAAQAFTSRLGRARGPGADGRLDTDHHVSQRPESLAAPRSIPRKDGPGPVDGSRASDPAVRTSNGIVHCATAYSADWPQRVAGTTKRVRPDGRTRRSGVEPPIGIEPMTYSLRVNRSAD